MSKQKVNCAKGTREADLGHAVLSASGSHRWLNCTPSARLELEFENTTSEAAREGTAAHLVKGEKIPEEVMSALEDEAVTKWAFNAQFERICISRMLGYEAGTYLVPASWKCSMVWSAYMGLPLSLEGVGAVLGLEKQKLTEGKDLILERQSQRTR